MPVSSLPVPSKNALRTLRRLALGTSCTVAFSAGMLTEDRRRRIHAARQVHDNAKKLKSSRNYHSAGAALAETLDEQVLSHGNGSAWTLRKSPTASASRNEEPLRDSYLPESKLEKEHMRDVKDRIGPRQKSPSGSQSGVKGPLRLWRPTGPISFQIKRYTIHDPAIPLARWQPPAVEWKPSFSDNRAFKPQPSEIDLPGRQHKLASDIRKILAGGYESPSVDAAALRFLNTFREGLSLEDSGLHESLMEAVIELCQSCRDHGKFETFEKILDIILSCGPIDQDVFFAFEPQGLIRAALKGIQDPATGHKTLNIESLKKACALFLTTFKERPKVEAPEVKQWALLGTQLCQETYRHQLFNSTEDIYWNLEKYSAEATNSAVRYLIRAAYKQKEYKKVVEYFQRFYAQTSPDQGDFYKTTKLVIDAVVEVPTPKYDVAEEVMFSILDMAACQGRTASTTCILRVLGSHWRAHRDIHKIRTLFERLKLNLQFTGHPQAVYGALIQFLIESGDEASALAYYEQMRKIYEPTSDDVRIYGHFAYSKAMRKDWDGVKNDFRHMKDSNPDLDEYCAAFTPILHLFAKSQSVRETEDLVREFVEKFDMVLTPYMSNIMIDKYLQAKEIDSVARWLEYMYSLDAPIATNFFNSVLMSCHQRWKFNFEEIFQLYQLVKKKGDWTKEFFNERTDSIMRSLAFSTLQRKSGRVTKRLKPWLCETSDPVQSNEIRDAMAMAVARGDNVHTLKLYKKALAGQTPPDGFAASIAVKASLRIYPDDIDATAALLQSLVEKGQDVSDAMSAIFTHQISAIYGDVEEGCRHVQRIARNTLSAIEDRGIRIPTRAVTHVMNILRARNQNREAIDFWESMSRRKGRTEHSLDLETLTVLLEAYIGLRDCEGINWVMHMVTVCDLAPDKRFKGVLLNAQIRAGKRREEREFCDVITSALGEVKHMRFVATEDKDNVKVKTIRIMERAIEVQEARECEAKIEQGDGIKAT